MAAVDDEDGSLAALDPDLSAGRPSARFWSACARRGALVVIAGLALLGAFTAGRHMPLAERAGAGEGPAGSASSPGWLGIDELSDGVVDLYAGSSRITQGHDAAVDGVNCFIDVYQAVLRLANAAVNVKVATVDCNPHVLTSNAARAKCSSTLNGAIYNFIFVAGMIAASVSDCSGSLVVPAACTANVAGVIGNLDVVAGTASGVVNTCAYTWDDNYYEKVAKGIREDIMKNISAHVHPWSKTTMPKPSSKVPEPLRDFLKHRNRYSDPAYQTAMTKCWIATNQGAMFLGRAAITITNSIRWCVPDKQSEGKGRVRCAADIVGLLGALTLAARFISLSIPACMGYFDPNDKTVQTARCSADVVGIAAGLFAAAAPAITLHKACTSGNASIAGKDPAATMPILPDARRLRHVEPEHGLAALTSRLRKLADVAMNPELASEVELEEW